MVQKCSIVGCQSKFDFATKIAFFVFPTHEFEKQQWISAISELNKQTCESVSKHSRVCEKHFECDQIRRNKSRCTLVKGAVPTIFRKENSEECCDVEFLETFKEESLDTSNEKLLSTSNENINDLNDVKREQAIQFFNEEQTYNKESFECERCGHINTTRLKGGFFEESQLQQPTKISVVSLPPHIAENPSENSSLPEIPLIFKNDPLSYESNHHTFDPELSTSGKKMNKKKRICYPGDVQEDEKLGETSSQKYISVLRNKIAEQRKQARTMCQKNRRNEKRIATLKSLLQELMEKTMNNGHSVVKPELVVAKQ